jgi:chemotaxis protein histidine kinase CheA/CheY-like chemotaxis protein
MSEPEPHPPSSPPRPVALARPGPALKQAVASRRVSGGVSLPLPLPLPAAPPAPKPEEAPVTVAPPVVEEPDYEALFHSEAQDLLGEMERAFLDWPSPEALQRLTRCFHTLTGSARTLSRDEVGSAAAALEKISRDLESGTIRAEESHRLALLQGCGRLAQIMGCAFSPPSPPAAAPGSPGGKLDQALRDLEAWPVSGEAAALGIRDVIGGLSNAPDDSIPPALCRSFGQMWEFLKEWGTATPPAPMQAVLRRCLGDACDYLQWPVESRPPWRRRWGLYFNSLRVALAVESSAKSTSVTPALDPEMVQAFMEEARGLFDSIEQAVIRWEKGEAVPECRSELRRHFHTLKGAANSVGLAKLGSAYHEWEEKMDRAETSPATPSELMKFNDRVRGYLALLQEQPDAVWDAPEKPRVSAEPPVDPELLEAFLEEGRQLLEPVETALMAWERGEDPSARQAELRRHFHTLKGAANSIGLRGLGGDFHVLEERMQQAVGEEERVRWIPLVLGCMDETRSYLAALASDPAAPWAGGWEARFAGAPAEASASTAAAAPVEKAAVRVEADRVRQLLDQSGEMVADLSRAEAYFQDLSAVRRQLENLREQMVRESEDVRSGKPFAVGTLGAWEKECAGLSGQLARLHRTHGATQNAVLRRGRQLQKDLAGLNMGPVSNLFRRLQRVFRDALQEESKEAAFETEGGQTRLDRTVLDRLYGPLLHVVRNAVAHGIEKPEVRTARGKPAAGRVRLAAIPFSDHVRIEVSDDGAGIDANAVRRRAIQRGLLPAEATDLSDEEVIRLLFTPGFSTKETVSSVAGRGVGLDVVKEEIEGMNGSVSVRFTPGQGAVWSIRVPLNLSASEALLVRAGEIRAALPLAYVVRCHRLRTEDFESRQGRLVLASCGLPYFALHEVLGSSAGEDPTHGIEVDAGSTRAVLGVHAILTRREVVSLDPGPLLRRMPVLSGVAPDSDGTLLPVLQIPQMLRRLAGTEVLPPSLAETRSCRVLLVDDSSSVRLAHKVLLEKMGWTVDLAVDGAEALGKIRADNAYDLVLSDLEMPGLDGRALLKAVRADVDLQRLPIVIVTSRRESAMVKALVAEGADACLSKPLDVAQLLSFVSRLEPGLANS